MGMWDNAVTQARKTLEAICFEICTEESLSGKRPVSTLSLDEMLAMIERTSLALPKSLPKIMRSLQAFGNLATHDQGESSTINENLCSSCLSMLDDLCKWFSEQYLKDIKLLDTTDSFLGEKNKLKLPPLFAEKEIAVAEPAKIEKKKEELSPTIIKTEIVDGPALVDFSITAKRKNRLYDFRSQIKEVDQNLLVPLNDLFNKVEQLGLDLNMGSGSRSIKTPFKIVFPDEKNRPGFKRAFNFGIIKSNGSFFNSSCEREIGRNYLTCLSSIIPNTTTRFMENEFKNTIIQNNGKPVPLKWVLEKQDKWVELIGKFLPYLRSQRVA
jgi:hypothetical protein